MYDNDQNEPEFTAAVVGGQLRIQNPDAPCTQFIRSSHSARDLGVADDRTIPDQ